MLPLLPYGTEKYMYRLNGVGPNHSLIPWINCEAMQNIGCEIALDAFLAPYGHMRVKGALIYQRVSLTNSS